LWVNLRMPEETLWAIQPHTAAKHAIVRRHLGAWYPKLAWTGHEVVVDGFAGPGEYIGGEPGSPIVALQTALEHTHNLSGCRLDFIFIEERIDRHLHLVDVIGRLGALPPNVHVQVIHGEFEFEVEKALADVKSTSETPVFLMVDPFGPSGLPYKLIRSLARRRRVDLLLSFMYGTMTRWLDQPNYERPMTELFGDETWREAVNLEGEARRAYLHRRYQEVLRSGGFSKVGSFELLDGGNATEYYLMFAGHHIEALRAIKAAMWAVDPEGGQRT
jgi:three-Cys-motif partner protein